jgi:DNA-binding response OmpR family regulator
MPEPELIVLVVSDDPLILEEARFGFPVGVEVHCTSDAREAVALMRDIRPSVALVDIQTGSAGGFSLAREMAQTARLRNVPICMLLEREQDSWLAREAGAKLLRIKPIGAGDLVFDVLALAREAA